MIKYVFDPESYGYRPPNRMPQSLKDFINKRSYVKIIAAIPGAFWYSSICQPYGDDRWEIMSGVFSRNSRNEPQHSSHTKYCGCITTASFAETLLLHLLGTTTDEGTLKHAPDRVYGNSLRIKRKKKNNNDPL